MAKKKKSVPADYFHPPAFARKRACVLGLGRSGFHAARLLSRKGFKVFVSDSRPRKELKSMAAKLPPRVQWEGGGHTDRVLACGFAVKSPGMAPDAPVLNRLREAGIPVFSELEVALAFCPAPEIFAVTGTNGKTTTVAMLAAILKAARRRVHVLGNIGEPLSQGVDKIRKGDDLVLEVSSYQLEDSRWFRPHAAALLNLSSDHLDHHGSMEAYRRAKARIFRFQDRSHFCVFNASDPLVYGLARDCRARKLFFGRETSTRAAAWIEGGRIKLRLPGEKKALTLSPAKLPGLHNIENAMAAALMALARGVKAEAIARGLASFKGVEHRIEDCGIAKGLRCINDSKATNVDSTLVELGSLAPEHAGRVLLILGGRAKPGGFAALRPLVERYVKAVLTIGEAARKIEEDLQGISHVFPCSTLEAAVEVAGKIGQKGELLLLSPACASFDQFVDYEDRGRSFKRLVRELGPR